MSELKSCPLCRRQVPEVRLKSVKWLSQEALQRMKEKHPEWRMEDGACPACVQKALLQTLLHEGESALHASIQTTWPLDAEAAFGAIPTPLRMHADPRFAGRGITIAFVDSAFYPHPDLVQPKNRIRAWVDASHEAAQEFEFADNETPRWPGWDRKRPEQWHGMMTSVTAAGNGALSYGLYRGIASEADLVLLQLIEKQEPISNRTILRALEWLRRNHKRYRIRIVNLSVGGKDVSPVKKNAIDKEISGLVNEGVVVVAAAGNEGQRRLVPPAAAPDAITVGGLDDKNTFDAADNEVWHSNYGESAAGVYKPELVAPSIWLAAPILPASKIAQEAREVYARRHETDTGVEEKIAKLKLITPHYQHVDGTSFAAPIVSSVIAAMLEANPKLTPAAIRHLLQDASHLVPEVSRERQGAGALDAGKAIALALRESDQQPADLDTPAVTANGIEFYLHDHDHREVHVVGSWDRWQLPGTAGEEIEPGFWRMRIERLAPSTYEYKFVLDRTLAIDDPENSRKSPDAFGGFNSVLIVADRTGHAVNKLS